MDGVGGVFLPLRRISEFTRRVLAYVVLHLVIAFLNHQQDEKLRRNRFTGHQRTYFHGMGSPSWEAELRDAVSCDFHVYDGRE